MSTLTLNPITDLPGCRPASPPMSVDVYRHRRELVQFGCQLSSWNRGQDQWLALMDNRMARIAGLLVGIRSRDNIEGEACPHLMKSLTP